MTTETAVTYQPPRFLALLTAEAIRLSQRRFVRGLLLAGLALYLFVIIIAFINHSKSGEPHPAFLFGTTAGDGAVGVGVGVAILMYIIGTTYGGAEWSQRTIVALLFWEPRRWRVMGAKILVVAMAAAVLTVVTQLVWIATAFGLASTRGDLARPSGFWNDLLIRQSTVLLLTVLVGLLGFGIANLVRNSSASLGVGFVYFVIVEFIVLAFWHWAVQFLLLINTAALLTRGGVDLGDNPDDPGQHLSQLHGGLEWGIVSLGVLAIGSVLFSRRDAS